MIGSIRRNARSLEARRRLPEHEPISLAEETLLRVTALTHDVGHGFLSHVSERAMNSLPTVDGTHTVRQLREEARDFFKIPFLNAAPAIGEILSAVCILLPEWQEVLKLAEIPEWSDTTALSRRCAELICGARDPKRPFLSEIISGPLDVDKLDYIPRDCYMAGVPMPVDVDRLMEKIQVVAVPASQIPEEEYGEKVHLKADETVHVLAVQTAGSRAFEELVISRFLLFEKLYYHQKIRAMEGGVVNALEILQEKNGAFQQIPTYLQLSDDEFLLQHWPDANDAVYALAKELISAVTARNPLVRCFAFGPGLVKDLEPDSNDFRMRWKAFTPKVGAERKPEWFEFRNRVAERSRTLLRLVEQIPLANALSAEQIVIDLPPVQGIAEKTKFFVGDEKFGVQQFINRFRVERWAEAYETQHTTAYVYTLPEFAIAVYLAVRDLIWFEAGLSFDDASWTRTKLSSSDIFQFSKMVLAAGDSEHVPFSEPTFVVERREFAQRNEQKLSIIDEHAEVLAELTERCKTFESYDGVKVTAETIRSWLLQFEVEEISAAIRVITGLKYWGRAALSDALTFAVADRFKEGFQAVALGAPTASAAHLSYLWEDARERITGDVKVVSSAAEILGDLPLVIYDDNVGSGGQASTIFSQWFGISMAGDLDEKHVGPLAGDVLKRLSDVPIFLVFATGFRGGLEKIKERLSELTQNSNVSGMIIDPADLSCFRPASRVFDNPTERERAKAAFARVGRVSLHDTISKRNWSSDKIESRLLGYGNAGGLTIFHYNVPTTTVTAIWSSSRSAGATWNALFPRRPRK